MNIGRAFGVVLAAAALAAGLSAGQQTTRSFTRLVAPFEILDADGRPYALPWLGGLDVPRPQFADIDGDGDLDLFVQEFTNAVMFFENTGTPAAPRYEWRSDRYQDLDIGEWYRFVDIDADGLLDVLAELPFSRIRYYRNTGTRAEARFDTPGTLQDLDGQPLFFDRQNIPSLVDIDCDKRLDLFAGRVEGTVTHFEAVEPGSTRFALIQEFWEGIEIIGGIGGLGFGSRHGANAIAFADFDGDGDHDLFWGDFFEPGVLLIENIGRTCSTPSFQVDPIRLPYADTRTSGYNAPAPVDIDADGDLDFLMGVIGGSFNPIRTSAANFYFWRRTAAAALTLETTRFVDTFDAGSESSPALADLDGDGDLDLLVGNKIEPAEGDAGRLRILMNEGSATAPRFRLTETLRLGDGYHLAPAPGDLDGDGDVDLLVGTWNQDIVYVRNDGTAKAPRFVVDEAGAIHPPRTTNASPALADLDGDGDLDLLVGQSNGTIVHYRNTGTRRAPRWELVTEAVDGIKVGRRSAPAIVDLDGDGLFDLLVGREEGGHFVFRNAGTTAAPRWVEAPPLAITLPALATPVVVDLDGDGHLDVVSGAVGGGLMFFRGSSGGR